VKLTVIGCGHLGATHAACMAEIGHDVLGVDIDEGKTALLNSGKAWFHEPGLDDMLARGITAGRLRFTTSFAEAAAFASVHFLGVATPGLPAGSYDLSQLRAAIRSLAPHLGQPALIIGKSTVTPGTAAALQNMVAALAPAGPAAEVAWNPEFLREGCAVQDTLRPDRIIAGVTGPAAETVLREIYQPLTDAGVPLIVTGVATAELAKCAANAFLATKVSFINAMADICRAAGADVTTLATTLGMDPRIGPAFLRAGIGYGGACLPKDVCGLQTFAEKTQAASAAGLLAAVNEVNQGRIRQVTELITGVCGSLPGARAAVWGAAFKPGTDDVRDSPGLKIASWLHQQGAEVTVHDPMASGNALITCPHLSYADTALTAVKDADVLIIVTAWPEFREVSPADAAKYAASRVLVDACQGVDAAAWRDAGWDVRSLCQDTQREGEGTGFGCLTSSPPFTAGRTSTTPCSG